MRPGPKPTSALRAVPLAAPGCSARVMGRADPAQTARALPPQPRNHAMRVVAAGLALSGLGHAALALWLVQSPALPPPDGPDVPAVEVSLLSGAQFAALTAPSPQRPEVIAPVLRPLPDDVPLTAPPKDLAPPTQAQSPVEMDPPAAELAPVVTLLAAAPPDPHVALLLPELTAPQVSSDGVQVARPAPDPAPQRSPQLPEAIARVDAPPVAPEAAPVLQKPAATLFAKPSGPPPAAPKAAQKPASQAGDGGKAETTRAKSAGSADARDSWLAAIRARVERRKAYPAAAAGAEGRVTLQLTVDRAGRLTAVGVARSSGHPMLDAAALRAVKSAGRFPKAPGAVTEAAVTFNLPLRFSAGS